MILLAGSSISIFFLHSLWDWPRAFYIIMDLLQESVVGIGFWWSIWTWLCWLGLLFGRLSFRSFSWGAAFSKFKCWELRDLVWFFDEDCNWRTNGDEIIRCVYFCDETFLLHLKSNSGLISFNFGNGISRLDSISFFDEPLDDFALFHGGG